MARSNSFTVAALGLSAALIAGLVWLVLTPKPKAPRQESAAQTQRPEGHTSAKAGAKAKPTLSVETPQEAAPSGVPDAPEPTPAEPLVDRQRANKLREALMALYGAGAPATSTPGSPLDRGTLNPYIRVLLEGPISAGVSACFENLLRRKDVSGSLIVELAVIGDPALGAVIANTAFDPNTTLKDASFRSCLTQRFGQLVLPPPPAGHSAFTIKQSFELAP